MAKIKRKLIATYMNVTPNEVTADYALLGVGITTAIINYNPQTLEETYIHEDSGTTEVESYRPTMPVEMTPDTDDDVATFIDALRKNRAVLGDAETTIVNVWLYETPIGTSYPAERQRVSIQIDEFGGPGGESAKESFTINYIGDPVIGTFDVNDSTFTEDSGS